MKLFITLALLLSISLSHAQADEDPNALNGRWFIEGPNFIEPLPQDKRDSFFYMNFEGKAANELMEKIKSEPKITKRCYRDGNDEFCHVEEHFFIDNIRCKRELDGGSYKYERCFITIDLENQKLIEGRYTDQADL